MPILDLQIGANDCDIWVYWNGATWIIGGASDWGAGSSSANIKMGAGLRWTGAAILPGSTITLANFSRCPAAGRTADTVNTRITGNKELIPAVWSTVADYQARRGVIIGGANDNFITAAQVDWDAIADDVGGTWYDSPDISTIIQEIINQPGWASGNPIALWWDDYNDRSNHISNCCRSGRDFSSLPGNAGKLHIEYNLPPGRSSSNMTDKLVGVRAI